MKHIQSKQNCLAACAAILLNISEEKVVQSIGRIWDSVLLDNGIGTGYHIQEILLLFAAARRSLSCYELHPSFLDGVNRIDVPGDHQHRFQWLLKSTRGILIAPAHAIVWTGTCVYDPALTNESRIDEYNIQEYYFEVF